MSIVFANLRMLLGLGGDAAGLTFLQISLRGVVVFVAALVIVRCGDRRFLSQKQHSMPSWGSSLHRCLLAPSTVPQHSSRRSAVASFWWSSIDCWRTGHVALTHLGS
jgi:hypothetical protein